MKWIDYAKDINLFETFNKDIKPMSNSEKYRAVRVLIDYFSKEGNYSIKGLPDSYEARRSILHSILDTYPPKEIDSVSLDLLEKLLISECYENDIKSVSDLKEVKKNIFVYKGDIRNLEVDAIVNATNSSLLGCMQPHYSSLDNAIHSSAGPRMRIDCNKIIEKQNHLEYVGSSKITRAYCLPSKYVLHTVGPIVSGNSVTKEQEKQLSSCYRSCLNLIKSIEEIKTIAFPCISTGTFGYPKDEAVKVAVNSVKKWNIENNDIEKNIIFNVFNEHDYEMYIKIIEEIL